MDRLVPPTLIVAARDDTLVPFQSFESDRIARNPRIRLLATDGGGHCAFVARRPARGAGGECDADRHWAENRVVDFLAALEERAGQRGAAGTGRALRSS